jgi:hypothetical protein
MLLKSGADTNLAMADGRSKCFVLKNRLPWDRCYDFSNIFAEKFGEIMAFLTQNKFLS